MQKFSDMQRQMEGMMSTMNVGGTTSQTSMLVSKPRQNDYIGNLRYAPPPNLRHSGPVGPYFDDDFDDDVIDIGPEPYGAYQGPIT